MSTKEEKPVYKPTYVEMQVIRVISEWANTKFAPKEINFEDIERDNLDDSVTPKILC